MDSVCGRRSGTGAGAADRSALSDRRVRDGACGTRRTLADSITSRAPPQDIRLVVHVSMSGGVRAGGAPGNRGSTVSGCLPHRGARGRRARRTERPSTCARGRCGERRALINLHAASPEFSVAGLSLAGRPRRSTRRSSDRERNRAKNVRPQKRSRDRIARRPHLLVAPARGRNRHTCAHTCAAGEPVRPRGVASPRHSPRPRGRSHPRVSDRGRAASGTTVARRGSRPFPVA